MLTGTLVTPQGLYPGSLSFTSHIESLVPSQRPVDTFILPGFIDTHVHGGGGADTMDGAEGVRTLAAFHLQHGTTTLYPTTITNPWEAILTALRGCREVIEAAEPRLPSIPGVHLEGPFISPERLGAQPPFALEPEAEHLEALLDLRVLKLATLAPEVRGVQEAAERLARAAVRVSIGHTAASFEQATGLSEIVRQAGGVVGYTHLFNAMTPLQSRAPGAVGAAMADALSYAEVILDTHHVHPASFRVAFYAKPERLHLITDSIRAAGQGNGESNLGGQRVIVQDGAARLPDGTLAGSVLTLDQALRHALDAGLSLAQVSQMLSATPATYMGLEDRGLLAEGRRADVVVLSNDYRVLEVYLAGEKVVG